MSKFWNFVKSLKHLRLVIMPQKISELLAAIERHWVGAKIYITKNPAKLPEACRVIFEAEQKLLKRLLEEGLATEFARAITCFKARNTIGKVIAAVKTDPKPWSACPPAAKPAPTPAVKPTK